MHRRSLSIAAIATLILTGCSSFNSDRISVATRGSGSDLILIPGLAGQSEEVWASVADTLDDRYRLHLVQVSGFGGGEPGANAEGPVSSPVAEEVARYIREAGLDRPAVIGHSMGGTVGMMLAARHSDIVGRLMVVDVIPFMGEMLGPAGATPAGLRHIADQARARILKDPPGTGFIAEMFQGMTLSAERQEVLMRHVRESDRRTLANAFHELVVTDLRPELSRITALVTVLYVQPPNVPIPPQQFDASMSRLYANAPNPRLVRIDDSRHFIHWDQPTRFTAEVDAFMKRGAGSMTLKTVATGLLFGESPRWRKDRLWVADWGARELVTIDTDGTKEVAVRLPFSSFQPISFDWLPDGRLLVVSSRDAKVLRVNADGSLATHADLAGLSRIWNEIVVDGRGNAYVNATGFDLSTGEPFAPGIIALVTRDRAVRRVADSLAFPNGMAVTSDNSTLIVAESHGRKLTAFDIATDGTLSNRRTWAELGQGAPDGICMDTEGAIWYGDVPNQRIVRVREGGEVLQTIDLDRGCFACMLGGADGRTLFVVVREWRGVESAADTTRKGEVRAMKAPSPHAGWP